jgi:hypothetical protein
MTKQDDERFEAAFSFAAESDDGPIQVRVDVIKHPLCRPLSAVDGIGKYADPDGRPEDFVAILRDAATRLERSVQAWRYPLPQS